MWPYLVGVEVYSRIHLEEVDARLALLGARRMVSGVWLLRCDYSPEALHLALKALLDDWECFFLVPIDEELYSSNLGMENS